MSARRTDEAGEVTQTPAIEIRHQARGDGPFGVRLVDRMPTMAVGAVELVAWSEGRHYRASVITGCDRGGPCGLSRRPALWPKA